MIFRILNNDNLLAGQEPTKNIISEVRQRA